MIDKRDTKDFKSRYKLQLIIIIDSNQKTLLIISKFLVTCCLVRLSLIFEYIFSIRPDNNLMAPNSFARDDKIERIT
jgi:hypothetical protein